MSPEKKAQFEERRAEARRKVNGAVKLWPEGFHSGTARGRLLDRSPQRFRVRHNLAALSNGQFVHFELSGIAGRARVIWSRIAGGHVESGLLIVDRELPVGSAEAR
jgi:hypothetical protein